MECPRQKRKDNSHNWMAATKIENVWKKNHLAKSVYKSQKALNQNVTDTSVTPSVSKIQSPFDLFKTIFQRAASPWQSCKLDKIGAGIVPIYILGSRSTNEGSGDGIIKCEC